MSIAGFDRLRETGRFPTPVGPANREELTAAGEDETTTVHQSPCPESEFCAKQRELVDVDVTSGDVDPGAYGGTVGAD